MFIKLVIDTEKCFSSLEELTFTSPQTFFSADRQECLLFNRLPTGFTEEDLCKAMSCDSFDFVWFSEKDFVAFHIRLENKKPIVKTIADRYGSWRIYHKPSLGAYIVTTNWQDVVSEDSAFSSAGLEDLVSSRVLYDNHTVFNGVQVNPLYHYSYYGGSLDFIETAPPSPALPKFQNDSDTINYIESSIKNSLQQINNEYSCCAVLLSGGVDSFILAALAKQIFTDVITYTPTWEDDHNPELERAQVFAKHLELEHHVVTLPIEEIGVAYHQLVEIMGIPIRNFSSVPLFALLKHIAEDVVLYGAFADTFFGSRPFKGKILDLKYQKLLRPFSFLPKIKTLLQNVSKSDNLYSLTWLKGISEKDIRRAAAIYFDDAEKLSTPFIKSDETINAWKNMSLRTTCRQHMVELEFAAAFYNKVVVTPFYSLELMQLSAQLTDKQMFGSKGLSILNNFKRDYSLDVKRLLKELACRYIDREHIYRNKLGFPTPHVKWIQLLFEVDLKELKARGVIDSTEPKYIRDRYEWVWTQLNLYHIHRTVKLGSGVEPAYQAQEVSGS